MDIEHLIATWRGPLVGLFAGWGASWADASALAQDTLVEAYLGRARLRGDGEDARVVGPWLRGIARNLWRSSRRRRALRREEELTPENAPAPDAQQEDQRLEALRRAIAKLPEKHRTVLYLHYLEETSVREVAALLELPEKTIEGRLYTARNALRERLARESTATQGELA